MNPPRLLDRALSLVRGLGHGGRAPNAIDEEEETAAKGTPIPDPPEWKGLTATGTRFDLLWHLWDFVQWHNPDVPTSVRNDWAEYLHFFFDHFMFKDDPGSMVGQSLFEDELPYVRRFIEAFDPFAHSVPRDLYFGKLEPGMIELPPIVVQRAQELYDKLLEKGDPEVGRYKK